MNLFISVLSVVYASDISGPYESSKYVSVPYKSHKYVLDPYRTYGAVLVIYCFTDDIIKEPQFKLIEVTTGRNIYFCQAKSTNTT